MKKRILIVIILMADVAFASPLQLEVRNIRNNTEIKAQKDDTKTLADAISEHLHARGLDKDVASKKVLNSLKDDPRLTDLMAKNILNHFGEMKRKDLIEYISNNALYNRSVDLSKYDHLIALIQKINGFKLDKESLEKVEKISFENKNIKSLHVAS